MATSLSSLGISSTKRSASADKTPYDFPARGLLVHQFDGFVEGYAGAVVSIYRAGTTTLMPVFHDVHLTQRAANPQTLLQRTDQDGRTYGKFIRPVYVPYPYELQVNSDEQSGITFMPIINLGGQDASHARVSLLGSTISRTLQERFGEEVSVLDFGNITDSPVANNEIINAALSAVAVKGGGVLVLPAQPIEAISIVLPTNVAIKGRGQFVTTLISQSARNVIEPSGDNVGIFDLTLDGVQLVNRSVGVYSKNVEGLCLQNVTVKRFATNMLHLGGRNHRYSNLTIEGGVKGSRLLGDSNFNGGNDGGEFTGLVWEGGKVILNNDVGLELSMRDLPVRHNQIQNVQIEDNGGNDGGLYLYGARFTSFEHVSFDGNVNNMTIRDNPDTMLEDRKMIGVTFYGGQIQGGINKFDGACQEVIFDHMELNSTTFQGNVPENQILIRNCVENDTLFTGDSTKFSRWKTSNKGSIKGVTTDATAIVAYKRKLKQNEVVLAEIGVTAERQNAAAGKGVWKLLRGATCAPLQVPYKEKTVNFTLGSLVQGETSKASGLIVADGSSILSLASVSGDFVDNELLKETDGNGSARVNGNVTYGTTSLLGASTTTVMSAGDNSNSVPGGWGAGFQVSGQELQVTVQGASSADVAWNIDINVTEL